MPGSIRTLLRTFGTVYSAREPLADRVRNSARKRFLARFRAPNRQKDLFRQLCFDANSNCTAYSGDHLMQRFQNAKHPLWVMVTEVVF